MFLIVALAGVAVVVTVVAEPRRSVPTTRQRPRVAPSALHTMELADPVYIDEAGMVGSRAKLDAIANWDWAMRIGRSWWNDAEMVELRVDPINADGTADLTTPLAGATYHFISAACRADRARRAETEPVRRSSTCALELAIDADGAAVRSEERPLGEIKGFEPRALAKPACSIPQAFDRLRDQLAKRPSYSVRLAGNQYSISSGRTSASMPTTSVVTSFCDPTARWPGIREASAEEAEMFRSRSSMYARRCMQRDHERTGTRTGKLIVRMVIDRDGAVIDTDVSPRSTLRDEGGAIGRCVSDRMANEHFPRPATGPSTVELPVALLP